MSEKNGWMVKFLATCLWGVVFGSILFMGKNIIANDKESRTRDKVQDTRHYETVEKNQQQQAETNVTLAKILTELKYITKR